MNDRLIGVNELAKILGVPPSWVYAHTRLKGPESIPRLKLGKYVRFDLDKVFAWIEEQQEKHGD